jgi:hypothetical protein
MSIIFIFVKSRSLTAVRRILGIKIVKSVETSNHIVQNIVDSFQIIGNNSRSKYCNASQRILSHSNVIKITIKRHFLQKNLSPLKMQCQNPYKLFL